MKERDILEVELVNNVDGLGITAYNLESGIVVGVNSDIIATKLYVDDVIGGIEIPDIDTSDLASKKYVNDKVEEAEGKITELIPNVSDIYAEVDKRISVNTALIEEIASNVVDIYKVPDKWVDGFNDITYNDCLEFVSEWVKASYFQHNNDLFTNVSVTVETESLYQFNYGFITTRNNKLFVYFVQVSCIRDQSAEQWGVTVIPTYEAYINQSDLDNSIVRIEALEKRISELESPSIL